MTKLNNKQILKKAIEKAVENGWQVKEFKPFGYDKKDVKKLTMSNIDTWDKVITTVFSHDFAKAFFGDRKYADIEVESPTGKVVFQIGVAYPEWQRRLREIVLEPEPLKYLEKFL